MAWPTIGPFVLPRKGIHCRIIKAKEDGGNNPNNTNAVETSVAREGNLSLWYPKKKIKPANITL